MADRQKTTDSSDRGTVLDGSKSGPLALEAAALLSRAENRPADAKITSSELWATLSRFVGVPGGVITKEQLEKALTTGVPTYHPHEGVDSPGYIDRALIWMGAKSADDTKVAAGGPLSEREKQVVRLALKHYDAICEIKADDPRMTMSSFDVASLMNNDSLSGQRTFSKLRPLIADLDFNDAAVDLLVEAQKSEWPSNTRAKTDAAISAMARAARAGDFTAQAFLGQMILETSRTDTRYKAKDAIPWLKMGALRGDGTAAMTLGELYERYKHSDGSVESHPGIQENKAEALKWYKIAQQAGVGVMGDSHFSVNDRIKYLSGQAVPEKPHMVFHNEPDLNKIWNLPDAQAAQIAAKWAESPQTKADVKQEAWWLIEKAEKALNGDQIALNAVRKDLEQMTALQRMVVGYELQGMGDSFKKLATDASGKEKPGCNSYPAVNVTPFPKAAMTTRDMVNQFNKFEFLGQCQQKGKSFTIDLPPMQVPRFTREK